LHLKKLFLYDFCLSLVLHEILLPYRLLAFIYLFISPVAFKMIDFSSLCFIYYLFKPKTESVSFNTIHLSTVLEKHENNYQPKFYYQFFYFGFKGVMNWLFTFCYIVV